MFALLMALLSAPACYSSDIVFLRSANIVPAQQEQLEIAAQFYGLNLKVATLGTAQPSAALALAEESDTLAVAIDAGALPLVNQHLLLSKLRRAPGHAAPLLILGVTPASDGDLLRAWSGGAITGASGLSGTSPLAYEVGKAAGITQELGGIQLPYSGNQATTLTLSGRGQTQSLLTVRSATNTAPVFIETKIEQQPIFLLASSAPSAGASQPSGVVEAFAAVAPAMLFVKYAAGDRGWHAPHHYANLTIDDPWLREPYGHLDYAKLVAEMDRHNFHTTIAFIPWNYDRSEPGVVALFRDRPDRLSICVHGDNHDHKEFTDLRSKPLSLQTADLAQGLARMRQFHKLTGLAYDEVFVFPHSIGSAAILGQMRAFNFLATANAGYTPIGSAAPAGELNHLRNVTTAFGDFPSILRYSAWTQNAAPLVAVNAFLGNPLIFYDHQSLFDHGIDAFDRLADTVNAVDPSTEWRNLGEIATHLYRERKTSDSDYDVFTESRSVVLENPSSTPRTYHVTKSEPEPWTIASVVSGGQPASFRVEGGVLSSVVTVPPDQTLTFAIAYRNNLNLAAVDIRHRSARVYVLRMVSDFRDIWLSRIGPGEALIAFYYAHFYVNNHASTLGLALLGVAMLFAASAAFWAVLAIVRRKHAVV